ncbi:ABC transporter permease subunit, partial [Streptococcus suis]
AVSLQVFFLLLILSLPLGAVFAFLMQIKFKPLQWLLHFYVLIMRGTPLLLQKIFVYYVLTSGGIIFDRKRALILA